MTALDGQCHTILSSSCVSIIDSSENCHRECDLIWATVKLLFKIAFQLLLTLLRYESKTITQSAGSSLPGLP